MASSSTALAARLTDLAAALQRAGGGLDTELAHVGSEPALDARSFRVPLPTIPGAQVTVVVIRQAQRVIVRVPFQGGSTTLPADGATTLSAWNERLGREVWRTAPLRAELAIRARTDGSVPPEGLEQVISVVLEIAAHDIAELGIVPPS